MLINISYLFIKEKTLACRKASKNENNNLKITINGQQSQRDRSADSHRSRSSIRSTKNKLITSVGPLFHTEWVYSSREPGKVIAYAYLTVCILRDYKFGFDKLYELIRDHLREKLGGVPVWASSAYRQWDLIRGRMRRETGSEWQKTLRRYVDSLTDLFTNYVMMFAATPVDTGTPFSSQVAKRLAFFA